MATSPRIVVRVGDRTLEHITSFSIRFSMRELADQVQLSVADKFILSDLKIGEPVGVAIEGRVVFVGETMTAQLGKSSGSRNIAITAFSSAQRLVKSDVIVGDGIPSRTLKGATLRQIVENVVTPFGLVVDVSAAVLDIVDEAIPKVRLKKGEKAHTFLMRVAKRQGCILVSGAASITPDRKAKSSIRITRAASRMSSIPIVSPSPRLLEISWETDARAVSSEYIVTRRGNGTRAADGSIEGLDGRAFDERVLYSPLIIQTSTGGNSEAELQRRAEFEMRKRAGEGARLTCTIDGWSPNYSQALWWPNTLYRVVDSEEGYDELQLLTSASLTYDSSGTRAALEFLPPDVFALLDSNTIKKGSRQGFANNPEWVDQHSDLVTRAEDGTDNVDSNEDQFAIIFKPEDPDA